ncbi:hypothetical protein SMICM304S_05058 [Streptomyces microflavus]
MNAWKRPESIAEITGFLGVYTNPNHIVAYTDGEIRQQYENTYIGCPGGRRAHDQRRGRRGSYVLPSDLDQYDIHPGMRHSRGATSPAPIPTSG